MSMDMVTACNLVWYLYLQHVHSTYVNFVLHMHACAPYHLWIDLGIANVG